MSAHPSGVSSPPPTTASLSDTTTFDLPGPSSRLWDDLATVCTIARVDPADLEVWNRLVLPTADHSRVHGAPQAGCPGCPEGGVERDMSSETSWREVAA